MKNFLKLSVLSLLFVSLFSFSSCSDDDDKPSINITFSNVTSNSVNISWTEIDGATSYDVDFTNVKTGEYSWEETTKNSYTLDNLEPGTEYEIEIFAYSGTESESIEIASAKKNVTTLDK